MCAKELILTVFILNLPFGRIRNKAETYSVRWILAVHMPVPFVFVLRRYCGFGWGVVPYLILAAVAGQLLGGKSGKII